MTTLNSRVHSKFSVVPLIRDHYATMRNHDTQRVMMGDYLVYVGMPLIAVGIGWWTGARANHVPQVLAAVAILTGLVFSAFSQGLAFRSKVDDKRYMGNGRAAAELTDQLRANVSYAVLLGVVLTALLGIAAMFGDTSRPLPVLPTMAVIFFGSQMLLTIFMVLKRIRAIYLAFDSTQPEQIP